jgi:hypothetical protein
MGFLGVYKDRIEKGKTHLRCLMGLIKILYFDQESPPPLFGSMESGSSLDLSEVEGGKAPLTRS